MKAKFLLFFAITSVLFFTSCKKDSVAKPQVTFTGNVAEGTANGNGEFTLTGHISSADNLSKVTLRLKGYEEPFFVDESTAQNKNEYDYSYLISGVTANITIVMDVYTKAGGKTSVEFLIKKPV